MKIFLKIISMAKKWNEILTRDHKKELVVLFFVTLFASILETLGVSVIVPFVSSLVDIDKTINNYIVRKIFYLLNWYPNAGIFIVILGSIVGLVYILKNIILLLTDYIGLRFENKIMKEFSILMLKSYLDRPYEDSLDINSAEVLRGIGTDVTAIYYSIQSIFKIISSFFTILFIGSFLIFLDHIMAIGIVIVSIILLIIITVIIKPIISKSGNDFNMSMLNVNKTALQTLDGLKEITVLGRKEKFRNYFEDATEIKRKAELRFRFLQLAPIRILETIFVVVLILAVCVKGYYENGNMAEFIVILSAFAVAAMRILPLINVMSSNCSTIIFYMAGFNDAYENITSARKNLKTEICDNNEKFNSIVNFYNKLELKNVSWKYRRASKNTFSNVNIEIIKGETIGIIGPSGAGKTTLADIVLGILHPQNGGVYIDGKNVENYQSSWHSMVGYVPQNVFLLDDTIRNNILFGVDEKEIDENRIWEVLDEVYLKEYVFSLPKKLNTVVGERGAKISGGQRQRIAIARALYYNPQILVLDEATSALDNETERAVMEAIDSLHGTKTLIIIAHRLSTLKKCDRVFAVENGKVSETVLPNEVL